MRQTWNQSLYSLKSGFLALSRVTFGKPALAIVLVTILHSLLFLPLKIRSARQARYNRLKLEKLSADVQAINDKYQPAPGERLSPALAAQKGNEIKELYKGEGVSFNLGCTSILLHSLSGIVLQSAITAIKDDERFNEGGILWFKDLTRSDRYLILPITSIGVSTLRQYLIPVELSDSENSQSAWYSRMRTIQKWMPLLAILATVVARKKLPAAALTLYQLTASGTELAVDYYIKRTITDRN